MICKTGLFLCALFTSIGCFAQQNLPDSPPTLNLWSQANAPNPTTPASTQQSGSSQNTTSSTLYLSRKDAENIALKNNPTISVAKLSALASEQVTREVKSNLWPTAVTNLTAVDAHDDSRIAAGGLNNPIIFERASAGATVSQLITDFGHTTNLVASARLHAKAEDQNAIATREQVLLAVDQAFYNALQAQALLKVADQTVNSRQLVSDQISALAKSKLKSDLDMSFANVNLSQAQLLQLDAENNAQAAMAGLSAVLGYPRLQDMTLVEETELTAPPAEDADQLITEAFNRRPELLALGYQSESDQKFRNATRDQSLPTVSALGAIGDTPIRDSRLSTWYGAVGVNVQIPVFNGFLFSARTHEADLRGQATTQRLLDLRNRIARDVRSAWLNARTAYQRLSVNAQLLDQANRALDLSQTRYRLGLGSIVELSQAQLQQTQAQIGNTQAGYEYRLSLSELRYQAGGATVTATTPPPAPKTRIKIDSVPDQYMPSNMSMFQPVSVQTFRFEVDPPTHRVRIVVYYTYPNENMLGKDDSQGGPQHTTAVVPGLEYDAESHTVVYQTNGTRTVCAQAEEHGKHIKVKNTRTCTVTAEEVNHTQDDGWKIHRGNMLDTYFEVH
ncbi:MAG TPA: TolC family protein [Terriglobales bacterium]|nr:TolC family protein [Terriglobales bacterium]